MCRYEFTLLKPIVRPVSNAVFFIKYENGKQFLYVIVIARQRGDIATKTTEFPFATRINLLNNKATFKYFEKLSYIKASVRVLKAMNIHIKIQVFLKERELRS